MAKSKEDYQLDGDYMYRNNSPLPTGDSWQQKAMAQGWINAQAEEQKYRKQQQSVKTIELDSLAAAIEEQGQEKAQAYFAGIDPGSPEGDRFVIERALKVTKDAKNNLRQLSQMIGGAYHHINVLRDDALQETNLQRKMRLMAKINKLERRHANT